MFWNPKVEMSIFLMQFISSGGFKKNSSRGVRSGQCMRKVCLKTGAKSKTVYTIYFPLLQIRLVVLLTN